MQTTSEGSTCWITITFKDKEGENQAPPSAEYRIDSRGGSEVRDWTPIATPSAVQELTMTPDDNTIIDEVHQLVENKTDLFQINIVTIRAEYAEDDVITDEYEYQIKDLGKIPKEVE